VEKYGTARQATDDNIIQRRRFVCQVIKATDVHSEYLLLFQVNNGYKNVPKYFVIRPLSAVWNNSAPILGRVKTYNASNCYGNTLPW